MNWIIFTTECSGKTTFCRRNNNQLKEYSLIDYDVITNVTDELNLIKLILDLQTKDKQIYLTNIFPPKFILNARGFFANIAFAIINLNEDELVKRIKERHDIRYSSNYILEHNSELHRIKEEIKKTPNRINTFVSLEEFVEYIYPPIKVEPKINLTKRIIRL
jgi:hypothetical protein